MADDTKERQEDRIRLRGKGVFTSVSEETMYYLCDVTNDFVKSLVSCKDKQAAINQFVKEFKYSGDENPLEVINTLTDLIYSQLGIEQISEIINDLKPFIDAELKDPKYGGLSLNEMLDISDNAEFGGTLYERMYHSAIDKAYIAYNLVKLKPFIEKELKRPIYEGKTLEEIRKESTEGDPEVFTEQITPGSLFDELLNNAANAEAAANEEKVPYRTIAQAGEDIKKNLPAIIADITLGGFESATRIQPQRSGNAYLQRLSTMDNLEFKDGHLFIKGDQQIEVMSSVQLQNLVTKEGIENLNLSQLRFYYSIIYSDWERQAAQTGEYDNLKLSPVIKLYAPDLLESRGVDRNAGQTSINAIISELKDFHNVVGVLYVKGRKQPSLWPVLNFEGYDTETNVISISSPYLAHIVEQVVENSIKRDNKGHILFNRSNMPKMLPINCYLVKSEISKERNKAAVENVYIICRGIAAAGEKNIYHISAKTLLEKNAIMQYQYERDSNKRRYLQKCFKRTWELLRDCTILQERYKNIVLPDPTDPAMIPSKRTLQDLVIEFPHEGFDKNYRGEV